MKVLNRYQCELCKRIYETQEEAINCESTPVTNDKGVKIGDMVLITSGDGNGKRLRVTSIGVTQKGWGPAKYDHSVFLTGDVIDSWGSRQLNYNAYEVLK